MPRKSGHDRKPASGKSLLCIDDQTEFLEATRFVLEREGHKVFLAGTGLEGLAIMEKERIDVLLLDYCMPSMSAEDILAEVRDPALQVVLLTGYSSEKPPREMLDKLNIQGYCDKSRGSEELLLWVEVALRFGNAIRLLESSREGLRQVLGTRLRGEAHLPLEANLDNCLEEILETLGPKRAFVGIASPEFAWVPPPRLEESPPWTDDTIVDLRLMAARGPWTAGAALSSQVEETFLKTILEAPTLEESTLSNGAGVFPLRADGRWQGVLYVEPAPAPDTPEWDMVGFYASEMATRIHNRSMTTLDPVSGLQNKAFWRQAAWRELRSAFRFEHPISLVLVSIAELDKIRHARPRVADQIVESVGRVIRLSIRGTDLAGRGDKDEFLVLLPHTGNVGAMRFGEMLADRLEQLVVQTVDGPETPPCALGVATFEAHEWHVDQLPHPMSSDYYPGAELLLRARAAASISESVPSTSGFAVVSHSQLDWPDPSRLAGRIARSTLWP
jgi:two-component system, cell cycle response regulator